MSRSLKKILYGTLYLIILFFIVRGIYTATLAPSPSCTDNTKNGNETGVDCGGSCVPCAIARLEPLRTVGQVRTFHTEGGDTSLLGEVINPNVGYAAASFLYEFRVVGFDNNILEQVKGTDHVFASERRFLFVPHVTTRFEKINRADLVLSSPEWKEARAFLHATFSFPKSVTTEIKDGRARVLGTVQNQSANDVPEVTLIAILFDTFGGEYFASQTLLSSLKAFEEREFVISFPTDTTLPRSIDTNATKVFILQ